MKYEGKMKTKKNLTLSDSSKRKSLLVYKTGPVYAGNDRQRISEYRMKEHMGSGMLTDSAL